MGARTGGRKKSEKDENEEIRKRSCRRLDGKPFFCYNEFRIRAERTGRGRVCETSFAVRRTGRGANALPAADGEK